MNKTTRQCRRHLHDTLVGPKPRSMITKKRDTNPYLIFDNERYKRLLQRWKDQSALATQALRKLTKDEMKALGLLD